MLERGVPADKHRGVVRLDGEGAGLLTDTPPELVRWENGNARYVASTQPRPAGCAIHRSGSLIREVPCPGAAYEHAVAAADEAASMSAHGEALELYRRAVRNLPGELSALDRAALFAALGDEAAATDDNTAAAEAYQTAHELAISARDMRAAAALAPRMVAVAHLLGEGPDARIGTLQAALDDLNEVGRR